MFWVLKKILVNIYISFKNDFMFTCMYLVIYLKKFQNDWSVLRFYDFLFDKPLILTRYKLIQTSDNKNLHLIWS